MISIWWKVCIPDYRHRLYLFHARVLRRFLVEYRIMTIFGRLRLLTEEENESEIFRFRQLGSLRGETSNLLFIRWFRLWFNEKSFSKLEMEIKNKCLFSWEKFWEQKYLVFNSFPWMRWAGCEAFLMNYFLSEWRII